MRITSKDYSSMRVDTQDVSMALGVLGWFIGHSEVLQDKENPEESVGKTYFIFKSEFHFDVWVRGHANETFLVLTAKRKGTCVEIAESHNLDSKTEQIISFLETLSKIIKENT